MLWPAREWILLTLLAGFILSGLGGCAHVYAAHVPGAVCFPEHKDRP